MNQEEAKLQHAKNAVSILEQKCNFVCNSEKDTYLSQKVILPSGAKLKTSNEKSSICITYNQKTFCEKCDCKPSDYELNLDTQAHKQAFNTSEFKCSFLKTNKGVQVECKG